MVEKIENGRFIWGCPWCGKKQLGLPESILNTMKREGERNE